nr:hypothetical protein CFP56_16247 [Quercus suber]
MSGVLYGLVARPPPVALMRCLLTSLLATRPYHFFLRNAKFPAPPEQNAFNIAIMRTEPDREREPLAIYGPGKSLRLLIRCTEWTEHEDTSCPKSEVPRCGVEIYVSLCAA